MEKEEVIKRIKKLKGKNKEKELFHFWDNLDLEFRKDMDIVEEIIKADQSKSPTLQRKVLNGSGAYSNPRFYQKLLNNEHKLTNPVIEKLIVIEDVKHDGMHLRYYPSYTKDTDVVKYALKQNGLALQYADSTFKSDYMMVDLAVKQNGDALKCADYLLQNDKSIIMDALKRSPKSYIYMGDQFSTYDDPDVMELAVKGDPNLIGYLPFELRGNSRIAASAFNTSGLALKYASKEVKRNRRLVKLAVKQNGAALQYADIELQADPEICKIAIESIQKKKKAKSNIDIVGDNYHDNKESKSKIRIFELKRKR